jgi:hypothetical protein
MQTSLFLAKGGLGGIVRWFIQVVIYDICVTSIVEIFGVSRMVALFIFLGALLAITAVGYVLKQKTSRAADE